MKRLIFQRQHANTLAYVRVILTFVTSRQLARIVGRLLRRFSDAQITVDAASSHRLARATLSLVAALALTSGTVVAQQQESVEASVARFLTHIYVII